MLNRKQNFDFMQLCPLFVANIHWGQMAGTLIFFLITCNLTPFYPIVMGFLPELIQFYANKLLSDFCYFRPEFSFECQIWTSYMTSQ